VNRVLSRYLLVEMLRGFAAVLACLVGIYLASRSADYLADAAAGRLQHDVVLRLVALKLLTALQTLVPVCLYLGVFLTLSRLQRDNELAAMQAAGTGRGFLLGTVGRLALCIGIPLSLGALTIAPWAERRVNEIRTQAQQDSDITGIAAGRFRELSGGDRVIYVEQLSEDGRSMKDVFLHSQEPEGHSVLRARGAELVTDPATRTRWVEFNAGTRHESRNDGTQHAVTRFERYRVRMDRSAEDTGSAPTKATPTIDLLDDPRPLAQAELQWRIAPAFVTLSLCLFAVLMTGSARGGRRDLGLLIALMGYFVYSNLLGVARSLLKRGEISPWLGLWVVHALALAIILLIIASPRLMRAFRRARPPRGMRPA
jgi:lipopolysaccharide export system permease protein